MSREVHFRYFNSIFSMAQEGFDLFQKTANVDISYKPEVSEHAVKRDLQTRHLSMIALGGCIETYLFVASGTAISASGPGSTLHFQSFPHVLLILHLVLQWDGTIGFRIQYASLLKSSQLQISSVIGFQVFIFRSFLWFHLL